MALDQYAAKGLARREQLNEEARRQSAEQEPAEVIPVAARGQPLPDYVTAALLDVVADPNSGIMRASICNASPETVEQVRTQAAEGGLPTQSACSPALRRGWIRIWRPGTATPESV